MIVNNMLLAFKPVGLSQVTRTLVWMFQVVWWCWLCCFKLLVMWMCVLASAHVVAPVFDLVWCCGVVWLLLCCVGLLVCCCWCDR